MRTAGLPMTFASCSTSLNRVGKDSNWFIFFLLIHKRDSLCRCLLPINADNHCSLSRFIVNNLGLLIVIPLSGNFPSSLSFIINENLDTWLHFDFVTSKIHDTEIQVCYPFSVILSRLYERQMLRKCKTHWHLTTSNSHFDKAFQCELQFAWCLNINENINEHHVRHMPSKI